MKKKVYSKLSRNKGHVIEWKTKLKRKLARNRPSGKIKRKEINKGTKTAH